ncbi:nuclear transport factor 2 family protein [Nocardioides sp. QY071]|uniref:nuclear transport factor 2 family protein n=1 Tax=Nocardioides sp. QY071 TaxID=3044187 RepID=UPI00249B90BB|nr:nuclear transport factor 2 family protein [Nocardioides sp. QY071]WGY01659.1 nuclear transport factor 2 family protein [Nocardioides sp. QY071]
MFDLASLIAREEIRALLIEYAQCADTGRAERMLELFAPEAVLEATGDPTCRGASEIRDYFERAARSAQRLMAKPYLRHHVSSIHIELDGAVQARSTSYFLAITDAGPDHWGRYRDTLRHDGTGWLIHHRRLQLEGCASGGWLDRHRREAASGGVALPASAVETTPS